MFQPFFMFYYSIQKKAKGNSFALLPFSVTITLAIKYRNHFLPEQ